MFIILVILDTNWAIIAGWTGKHTTALYFIGLEEIIFITIVFSLIMFNCIAFKDKECETKENPLVLNYWSDKSTVSSLVLLVLLKFAKPRHVEYFCSTNMHKLSSFNLDFVDNSPGD